MTLLELDFDDNADFIGPCLLPDNDDDNNDDDNNNNDDDTNNNDDNDNTDLISYY